MKRSQEHKDMVTIKVWVETRDDLNLLAVLRKSSMARWLNHLVKEDLRKAMEEVRQNEQDV